MATTRSKKTAAKTDPNAFRGKSSPPSSRIIDRSTKKASVAETKVPTKDAKVTKRQKSTKPRDTSSYATVKKSASKNLRALPKKKDPSIVESEKSDFDLSDELFEGAVAAAEGILKSRRTPSNIPADIKAKVRLLQQDSRFKKIKSSTLRRVVEEFNDTSIIINASMNKPIRRRVRCPWSAQEENDLRRGVSLYGHHWSAILNDPNLHFEDRTQVDLKDKWRNMESYRIYSEIRKTIRRYVLVDSDHNLIWSDRNSNHYFNNRWPIDAALKAATKDFVYASGQNQARIYLKEVPAEGQEGPALVHVFEVTRTRQNAVDIPKFKGKRTAWVGQAKKLSTERYLDKEAILSVIAPDQIPV